MNILILVAMGYLYFMVKLLRGWRLFSVEKMADSVEERNISILIPIRNEAANLPKLLVSLEKLDYQKTKFEVIFIDDHSEDESANLVKTWLESTNIISRLISAEGSGKKAAQAEGIACAANPIIACTDADCTLPKDWLLNISACFNDPKVALAFGPVVFESNGHALQKIEFAALIASTMAMLKQNWAVMGNAANMAFRKEVFLAAEQALKKVASASGDDVFLLHHIAKTGQQVATLKAMVSTMPQPNFESFLNQRLRWAAKARYYTQPAALAVGALVLGVNVLLLAGAVALLFGAALPWSFWLLLGVKWGTDFLLLQRSAPFFQQTIKPHIFLLQEILNVVYVPAVAMLSQIMRFTWKGRRY